MSRDEKLNKRIRTILSGKQAIEERNMFGGTCFLHNGNMICGADSKNGLMIRVGPEQYADALQLEHTREMDFTGRPMKGFIFVDEPGYRNDAQLNHWIERAMAYTKKLPHKRKK